MVSDDTRVEIHGDEEHVIRKLTADEQMKNVIEFAKKEAVEDFAIEHACFIDDCKPADIDIEDGDSIGSLWYAFSIGQRACFDRDSGKIEYFGKNIICSDNRLSTVVRNTFKAGSEYQKEQQEKSVVDDDTVTPVHSSFTSWLLHNPFWVFMIALASYGAGSLALDIAYWIVKFGW